MLNLLSNATKYTPDGGSIRIKASSYGSFEAQERFGKYLNPTQSAFRFLEVMVISESKFNIERLANHLNMSHSNVYRKIKAITGNTVIDFIRAIRLKQSLKLMETKKYNLAEISYLTGFTSPSYFTKTFREYYGNPPSDYLTDD